MTKKQDSAAKSRARRAQTVVGWRELVCLPDWGVSEVDAKVDTGARTSALHVEDLREEEEFLVFEVPTPTGPVTVREPMTRLSRVRPSSGETQERFVVETVMKLGPIERTVEISLSSRDNMLTAMLVGRRALRPRVLVDPLRRYLHGRPSVEPNDLDSEDLRDEAEGLAEAAAAEKEHDQETEEP